jgi:hypothetical protein
MLTQSIKSDLHALLEITGELLQRCIGDLDTAERGDCHIIELIADSKQSLFGACVTVGMINVPDPRPTRKR